MPEVIEVDEYEREVLDVTDTANRPGCLRAERRGRLGLVLHKLDSPIVRFDGKRVSYQLEDTSLYEDDDNELACVAGNDFTYWSARELSQYLKEKKPLFSFLTVY